MSDRLIGAFSTVATTVNAALDLNLPELELSSGWAVHTDVWENMPEFRQVFEAAVIDSFADPRLKENYEAVNYPWESVEYGGPRRPAAGTIVGGVYAETIQSLGISIVDEIRFDILSEKLPPGAKMTVKMLCERYDCGASPLREALNQLSSDSLVVRIDRRGFFVSHFRLSNCQREVEGTSRTEVNPAWETAHMLFHMSLLSASGSKILLNNCEKLYELNNLYCVLSGKKPYHKRNIAEDHKQIQHLAPDRNTDKALAALLSHYSVTGTFLFDEEPDDNT